MESVNELNNNLVILYTKWAKQLDETSLTSDKYSNPYYVSIPENWSESKNRIMIVGEEGAGSWGCGKTKDEKSKIAYNSDIWNAHDIDKIQQYNREQIDFQCKLYKIHNNPEWYENRGFVKNKVFWQRFRKIFKMDATSVIWNNLDKIHSLSKRNRSFALFKKERESLHKTNIKILQEEITLLKPTLIIFFGWHWNSLSYELPEIYEELCKDWKKIAPIQTQDRTYIFSYHPNARKGKEYENDLLKTVQDNLIKEQ